YELERGAKGAGRVGGIAFFESLLQVAHWAAFIFESSDRTLARRDSKRTQSSSPASCGLTQTKLAASSMLPRPLYCACCGYTQSGRVLCTPCAGESFTYLVAMILAGASPCSTHRSSAMS